jgi:hypothetical protein
MVAAALAGCPPGGVKIASLELRFLRNQQPVNDQTTVVSEALPSSVLQPVPTVDLRSGIGADLFGQNLSLAPVDTNGLPGAQMEAHLFVADLVDANNYFRSMGAAQAVETWDQRANPSSLGGDVAMAYPPNAGWDLTARYEVYFLNPGFFWPIQSPGLPASMPSGNGSVKSARIYKPGLCSVEVPFFSTSCGSKPSPCGLFDQVSDTFYSTFASSGSIDKGSANRGYSRVTTLLDQGANATAGPYGGFYLYFWFTATGGDGYQDINFAANYEYDFTLDDGRIAVLPVKHDLLVEPQSAYSSFKDALENQLPQGLRSAIVTQQEVQLGACNSDGTTTTAQNVLGLGAAVGGAKLGFTSTADQNSLQAAAKAPDNWTCINGNAFFILRAKRINVYPDAIELVWFDGANPSDPMYALYAAAVAKGGNSVSQLCARPRMNLGNPGGGLTVGQRPIVTVAR